jgi:hypothetical protein
MAAALVTARVVEVVHPETGRAIGVPVTEDGFPVDTYFRQLARVVFQHVASRGKDGYKGSWPSLLLNKAFREKHLGWDRDCVLIAEVLTATGYLAAVHRDELWPHQTRYVANIPSLRPGQEFEARLLNFREALSAAATRIAGEDRSLAQRLLSFARRFRSLYAIHEFGNGLNIESEKHPVKGALLAPLKLGADAKLGPCIEEAMVIAVLAPLGEVACFKLRKPDIEIEFEDDDTVRIRADLRSALRETPQWLVDGHLVISTYPSKYANRGSAQLPSVSMQVADGFKAAASAYIGHSFELPQWRSFRSMLLRKKRSLRSRIVTALAMQMDTEARRAASRSSSPTLHLYGWLCGNGSALHRERRLQASAAFPILTPWLSEAEATIDNGEPLAPVLCKSMGLPKSAVRHLNGVHWQRAYDYQADARLQRTGSNRLLAVLPPDYYPVTKVQWKRFGELAVLFQHWWPEHVNDAGTELGKQIRGDAAYADIEKLRDIHDFLRAVGFDLARASRPKGGCWDQIWSTGVAQAVCGNRFSIKRLQEASDAWHRNLERINEQRDTILTRGKRRGLAPKWLPLTRKPFICDEGRIDWLVTDIALLREGRLMKHCVGGYTPHCMFERVHIGSVRAKDGGRSTVEFRTELDVRDADVRYRALEVQHRTLRNDPPSQVCKQIVASFASQSGHEQSRRSISDGAPGMFDVDALESGLARRLKRRKHFADPREIDFENPRNRERILMIYAPILGKAADLGLEDWRKIFEDLARRAGQVGEVPAQEPFAAQEQRRRRPIRMAA